MKKIPILFFLLLLTGCLFENPPRPGYFDPLGPIIWKGKINLVESHYIGVNDILIIEKGTIVTFNGNITLLVDGSLKVQGESSDRVEFINSGHIVLSGQSSKNEISWCNITESTLVLASDAIIVSSKIKHIDIIDSANPDISYSSIGDMICKNTSNPVIRKSQFDRTPFYSDSSCIIIKTYDTSSPVIQECNFLGNSSLSSVMTNHTVLLYSSALHDFRNNWWTINDSAFITNKLVFRSLAADLWHTPIANIKNTLPVP